VTPRQPAGAIPDIGVNSLLMAFELEGNMRFGVLNALCVRHLANFRTCSTCSLK
jgi:hypothetical protein